MKVYNTLTRKKEEFIPLNPDEYRIYVCGPTVYNYIHIGNARPFVVFDTLRKYLEYRGNRVRFIQNFTDVDDKIINRAREEGVSPFDIGQTYIDAFFEDVRALNVEPATVHPRVTETIPEIIDFVSGLVDNGLAYEVNGDVYYSARKFTDYGKLSKQNIEELEAGSRVGVDERKHDPLDFVLWKAQKEGEEMAWDSPWGPGRPGWHIECSAMAKKYLGETIDLHAGGQDLQFPHHENEIAQSEGYTGKPFARYWMHNGYITVDDEKMSKSLGNFFTVRDILKEYEGEVLRYFLLSGHYRGPINFSRDLMEQSKNSLERMQNAKANLLHLAATGTGELTESEQCALEGYAKYRQKFIDAMDDDLNTADAISAVFELIRDINTDAKQGASRAFAEQAWQMLDELTAVLGLLRTEAENGVDQDIQALIDERQQARARKDFARADAIRDELAARGITLKDTPQGVQILRN
jgi:cysteinyl-tRNA synthetase